MRPYEFPGGFKQIYVLELDMRRQGMANDWSFTAWGENGEVEITVVGRGETQHFPYIIKDDDLLPATEGGSYGNNNNSEKEQEDQTANNLAAETAAKDAEQYEDKAAEQIDQLK